jgi:hypothetical protein
LPKSDFSIAIGEIPFCACQTGETQATGGAVCGCSREAAASPLFCINSNIALYHKKRVERKRNWKENAEKFMSKTKCPRGQIKELPDT